MTMYALAVTPLISKLQSPNVNQIWFADNASATADLRALRTWWDSLLEYGPAFGYFPNAQKSWILVKEDRLEEAKLLFKDTKVNIIPRRVGGIFVVLLEVSPLCGVSSRRK